LKVMFEGFAGPTYSLLQAQQRTFLGLTIQISLKKPFAQPLVRPLFNARRDEESLSLSNTFATGNYNFGDGTSFNI